MAFDNKHPEIKQKYTLKVISIKLWNCYSIEWTQRIRKGDPDKNQELQLNKKPTRASK